MKELQERLSFLSPEAVADALAALAAQGVLAHEQGDEGEAAYRIADPDRYAHWGRDVIQDPGRTLSRPRRSGGRE